MTLEQFNDVLYLACEILETKYDHSDGFIKQHRVYGDKRAFNHIFFVAPSGYHKPIAVITDDVFHTTLEILDDKALAELQSFVEKHEMFLIAHCAMKETIWN